MLKNKNIIYESIITDVSKIIKKHLNELHKWDDENDENILKIINLLYNIIKANYGNFGLRSFLLRADNKDNTILRWAHKCTAEDFYKKGIEWRDNFNIEIYVQIPNDLADDYFKGNNIITFDEMSHKYNDIIKCLQTNKKHVLNYNAISDVLYAFEYAVQNTSYVYLCAEGYQGTNGNIVNWLHKGVDKMIDDIKYWAKRYPCYIKISEYAGKKMINYLQKKLKFIEADKNYIKIKIEDLVTYHDELIDILS